MIKSEHFAIKTKQLCEKSGFQPRICFLLRHHFKSSSMQPLLLQTDYKTKNRHIISSNKRFAARQIALKEKEVERK